MSTTQQLDHAEKEGYHYGKLALPRECHYPAGSDLAQRWEDAYTRGENERLESQARIKAQYDELNRTS